MQLCPVFIFGGLFKGFYYSSNTGTPFYLNAVSESVISSIESVTKQSLREKRLVRPNELTTWVLYVHIMGDKGNKNRDTLASRNSSGVRQTVRYFLINTFYT